MQDPNTNDKRSSGARLVTRLVLVTVVMFGFGYALVPLYDLLCEITGIDGRTGIVSEQSAQSGVVDEERLVTVEFTSNTASDLPWDFHPLSRNMDVQPGKIIDVMYYARNRSSRTITAQAIPSVTPGAASRHFKKTVCFCFNNQTLGPGESKEMAVRFVVDSALPDTVHTITLSYAFYKVETATADNS